MLSVSASVKRPYPLLPQSRYLDSHTTVNNKTKTLHLKAHAGQTIREELVIQSRNPSFESAALDISKWGMDSKELERRSLSGSLKYAALCTAVATLDLDSKNKTYWDSLPQESDKLIFLVEGGDQYFILPKSVVVPADQNGAGILPVEFCAENEGQYECHVVLRSKYDVRILVIESTVLARGRHAQLEFHTSAMQSVTQDIPLVRLL